MRSISRSSAELLTRSFPCKSSLGMAQLLLCPQTLRCHAAELEPGSDAKGLKLFSDPQSGCRPSLLDHTPRGNQTQTQQGTWRGRGQAPPNTSSQVWRDSWLPSYTSLHGKPALFIRAVKKVVCKWVMLNFPFFLFGKRKPNGGHAH